MSTIKHKETFVVRSYEIDPTGYATLPAIANYFQEAAGIHARKLQFDIEDLMKKNATWVLYRMHVKMNAFPGRWEEVTVQTWPSSGDGVRAFRDYELLNSSGERLGVGVSQWMVLNIKNRRPMRMPEEVMNMGLTVEEHTLPVDKSPYPQMPEDHFHTELPVGNQDIDMNRHVNNVKYLEWATGYLPESEAGKRRCTELSIQYHKEARKGAQITVKTGVLADGSFVHNIVEADTGQLLAEGQSEWS